MGTSDVKYHITVLELYTFVLSIHLFAETLSNKVVLFLTDNEALIPIINKGTSKDLHFEVD